MRRVSWARAITNPGVYVTHALDRKSTFLHIFAILCLLQCRVVCKDCSRKVRAEVARQLGSQTVKILAKGRHGTLDGRGPWNVAQQFVLNKHFPQKVDVKAEDNR